MRQMRNGSSARKASLRWWGAELKREPKSPADCERVAEHFVALLVKNPDAIRFKGFDPAATLAELRECLRLLPIVSEAQEQLARAQEQLRVHESNVWRVMLQCFQHARTVAPEDEELQQSIAAFEELVKSRTRELG